MGIGLGVPLESEHPRMVEAVDEVLRACREHKVAPGIHCSDGPAVGRRIGQGFQFCAMASELRYMLVGLRADLAQVEWQSAEAARTADEAVGAAVRY
jgi:4-hydroxy-2-oxoheptanedioate aldolase